MNSKAHVGRFMALFERKLAVEAQIDQERRRPAPCSLMLQGLKRRRLQLKDAITRLRRARIVGEAGLA